MPTHVLNNCFGVDSYVLLLCTSINKKKGKAYDRKEMGCHTYLSNVTDKNNVHNRTDGYN